MDFAFSPMFDTNNFFYVSWTVDDSVSVRLTMYNFLYAGDILAASSRPHCCLNSWLNLLLFR